MVYISEFVLGPKSIDLELLLLYFEADEYIYHINQKEIPSS